MVPMVMLILLLLATVIAAMSPAQFKLSQYERQRQINMDGDKEAYGEQVVADVAPIVVGLQRLIVGLLLAGFVMITINAYGRLTTLGIVFVSLVIVHWLSQQVWIADRAQRLYKKAEPAIAIKLQPYTGWLLPIVGARLATPTPIIHSRYELINILRHSPACTSQEIDMIEHSLKSQHVMVDQIMTPRENIHTVKKSEILGPLVLDDLHKTGYSRFPVIGSGIDHILGIVHVRDILTLDTNRRHTAKAESAMDKHVSYIHESASIEEALSAFLSTHHHMLIVIDSDQRTVGLLTIEDTIKALLGRKLIDPEQSRDSKAEVARHHTDATTTQD